jgi:hypothetical protein
MGMKNDCSVRARKGSYRYGAANHKSKLDEGMVKAIRASAERYSVLAQRYRVSTACITRVRRRIDWSHVA